MQSDNNSIVAPVQIDLVDIFMDLNKQESNIKEQNKAQRKLAARRGIEQHYEKKQLEAALKEFWEEV
ncbi:PA3496 family putative envelope integrity protein [Alkalimarinus sediminis]|uniref:Uncharacterized protein n=1 Tax=Alkalimarinus sediminis TaxID=1632866 RepID=A0A9E8KQM6_9ALTE|nr:hypothetical protein [Alkalimarinus sediminis]UZW74947.1 hypothetical protein NNL22_18300 [Alkalimarinus sediminis]